MSAITVIVPARDAAATLPAALDALAAQELPEPPQVIVVDNGSRDDTAALAERHPLAPEVIRRARGEGPGAARNAGAARARSAALAFTDADCVPAPRWLAAGLAALESADVVQGAVLPDPSATSGPWDRTLWVTAERGLYEAANLFLRREWFERLGGFEDCADLGRDPRPFGEDAWLGWRARRSGARTGFCAEALVHHAVLPGDLAGRLRERARERRFPALVRRIPELRDSLLWGRWFLSARAAALDGAAAGAALAALRRSPLPLTAALPYAALVAREAAPWGARRALAVAAGSVAGDAVGLAARLAGSAAARTVVI